MIYNKEACQNLWRYFLMFCSKKTTNTVVLAQPDHTRTSQHTLYCAVSNCYSRGFTFTRATSALKTDDWDVCIYTITTVTDNFHNHALKYYKVVQYLSNIVHILCLICIIIHTHVWNWYCLSEIEQNQRCSTIINWNCSLDIKLWWFRGGSCRLISS